MKQTLLISLFILLICLPFVGIGLAITSKIDAAYRRGYQEGIDKVSTDKQCLSWLFNSNLQDVKNRVCK